MIAEYGKLLRRLTIPAITLTVALVIAVGGGLYLNDKTTTLETRVARVTGANGRISRQINILKQDTEFIAENVGRYRTWADRRLFEPPDRLAAARRFRRLAAERGINELRFEFEPAERYPIGPDRETPVQLVATPVRFTISSLFDRNVFGFLDAVRQELDGYVTLRRVKMERVAIPLDEVLARIEVRDYPSLITAEAVLDWITLDLGDRIADDDGLE